MNNATKFEVVFRRLTRRAPSGRVAAIQFVYLGAMILAISELILGVALVCAGVYRLPLNCSDYRIAPALS